VGFCGGVPSFARFQYRMKHVTNTSYQEPTNRSHHRARHRGCNCLYSVSQCSSRTHSTETTTTFKASISILHIAAAASYAGSIVIPKSTAIHTSSRTPGNALNINSTHCQNTLTCGRSQPAGLPAKEGVNRSQTHRCPRKAGVFRRARESSNSGASVGCCEEASAVLSWTCTLSTAERCGGVDVMERQCGD
jgi:hypothetical protein